MMRETPWWLLLLNALLVLPTVGCPLFLFGGLQAFATPNAALRVLNYVVVQLCWVVPLVLAVVSVDQYRRGWHARGVVATVAGMLFAATLGLHLYQSVRFAY